MHYCVNKHKNFPYAPTTTALSDNEKHGALKPQNDSFSRLRDQMVEKNENMLALEVEVEDVKLLLLGKEKEITELKSIASMSKEKLEALQTKHSELELECWKRYALKMLKKYLQC